MTANVGSGVLVLNSTAAGALLMSGNSILTENGPLVVDSSSPTAIQLSGNAQMTASRILEVGGYQRNGNAASTRLRRRAAHRWPTRSRVWQRRLRALSRAR